MPPVGELIFEDPPGDVHIKYGYIKGDEYYVIKLASGFYDNPKRGLPSVERHDAPVRPEDGGAARPSFTTKAYLTNVRTAAAGAVAAKYLAPAKVIRAGILGAGAQGRLQLEYLRRVREFPGRLRLGPEPEAELASFKADMEPMGFRIATTLDPAEVAASCNVIVTCTPSTKPLLRARDRSGGGPISRPWARTPRPKSRSSTPTILASRRQGRRGQPQPVPPARARAYRAMQAGAITKERLVELGDVIMDPSLRPRVRTTRSTVADLTGVAVQDIQIAKAVFRAL